MCTNSVNTTQMQQAIEQAEMTVKLAQGAVHQLEHNAEHLGDERVSSAMSRAATLLADARGELMTAIGACESSSAGDVAVVELV